MPKNDRNTVVADRFSYQLRLRRSVLTPRERRVATFIDENRVVVVASSAAALAASTGTSDATVIRAVQALGFKGLPELKRALVPNLGNRSTLAEDMQRTLADVGESATHAIDMVLKTHRRALDDLQSQQVRRTLVAAITTLHRADRIVVFGIGRSAQLARYAAILLARNGRRAYVIDGVGLNLADQLLDLRDGDALLTLAYGRSYREANATYAEAHKRGLPIVLVTDALTRKLARRADVVIPVQRGRTDRVALHGTTLIALEALILGLAASNRRRAIDTLRRLNDLREIVNAPRLEPA